MSERVNLFQMKRVYEIVREPLTEEEFIARVRQARPTEIFCHGWDRTPLYVLSKHGKDGCLFVCNGRADKTPQWVPYKGLYKIMRNELSSIYYTFEKATARAVAPTLSGTQDEEPDKTKA